MNKSKRLTVGRTRRVAVAPRDRVCRGAIRQAVAAVALVTELDAGEREALALAEARAEGKRHARRGRRRPGKRTGIGGLGNASGVGPARRQRRSRSDKGRRRTGVGARRHRPSGRADGVAAGKSRKRALRVLVDDLRLHRARVRLVLVDVRREDLARGDVAVHVVAVVHRVLEHAHVPAVLEVRVEGEAGGVARGEHVRIGAPVVVARCADDHLVEEADEVHGVRGRAGTGVVVVNGVGHVRLVVCAVEVDTVPAHREEDLVADTVLTGIDVGEVDVLALSVSGVVGDSTGVV